MLGSQAALQRCCQRLPLGGRGVIALLPPQQILSARTRSAMRPGPGLQRGAEGTDREYTIGMLP